jgi:two-component system, LytTR family, response regulator AlgR
VDFLTKPVQVTRLQATLERVAQRLRARDALAQLDPVPEATVQDAEVLTINDRGRVIRVPISEVLYLKAELKYLTVRTASDRYVMDGTLGDWEQRLAGRFLRIHRNALVAKSAVRELDRHRPTDELGEGDSAMTPLEGSDADTWSVRVGGVNEWLAVSRRQLGAVREALKALG